ncbi:DAK2 domain-containing protein [Paracoccus seriniphilus]|uniref:Dihydroxyacetone kinase, C-terminal domain n=1 Tax=Paracoccus seriniphilus TaxID=184748 RepID=A0A239Q0D9_9RHOB|nr:DAK2 domain-containing protein [Paracoccus seriniphilus]WCR15662.1 DAK2 domain-containing protein [Paracoccus seriniphilus]SNT75662.1 dihydroxyacetone kinase, C-terminal domain [Paracoccus seriniphilus]
MSAERYFNALREKVAGDMAHLNALDAALGDGDHGTTLLRGLTSAARAAEGQRAKAFMRASGGASGTLFGLVLHEIEQHLEAGADLGAGLARAEARICDLGQVKPGDKSMIDALSPAVQALQGGDLAAAVAAAGAGRDATVEMIARRGRAQYVEGGGQGHMDPGAVSLTMMLALLAETEAAA